MINTIYGWRYNVRKLAAAIEQQADTIQQQEDFLDDAENEITIAEDTDSGLISGSLREVLIDIYTKLGSAE